LRAVPPALARRRAIGPEDVLLVVTKDPSYRDYFRAPRQDLVVFSASSAGEALDLLFEERPDVLILDLEGCELPGLHLLHAAKRLRRRIASIVLSASPSDADAGMLQDGVFYYAAKPPDPAELEPVLGAARAAVSSGRWSGSAGNGRRKEAR